MKFLTFGEIMLRLKSPGLERFFQSPMLEATFGGGEANVAVSLANYGQDVAYLTVLPKNTIADECVKELRKFGVDTSRIVRSDKGRVGIYYLETGANARPSKVVYDREYSAIALAKPGDIDWDKAFEGVDWFHITGITPAISETAMELSLESVKEAKKRGITVVMEDFDAADSPYRDAAGVRYFLDRVPELRAAFDTGNFAFCDEDELDAFELLKDRIAHVHLKDRALTPGAPEERPLVSLGGRKLYAAPFGSGIIRGEEILRRLQKIGYDGVLTVEHYGAPRPLEYMERSAQWLRAHL